MNLQEVKRCIKVLDLPERVIVKLAIIVGMRPGEIFGLTWEQLSENYVEIVQRVYRGKIDIPKTNQFLRKAALPGGLAADIACGEFAMDTKPQALVFASERRTPLAKENV